MQTPQERLQQEAARDAREMHHDLHDAGREAGQALRQAASGTRAIVAGVREGWQQGDAGSAADQNHAPVNINHAPAEMLARLPGIDANRARAIVAARPFRTRHDLVKRGVLTETQYARVAGRLSVD
ncbi:helix-hairpin-helix domain-containing protein [Acidipila sp. EB88]|uniref:ComEA family DNA-binding protein n=1 Tax=Acidipila sp. EB88 TaxID=2305226 RepID=UPI0013154E83|nr:helix-hairpin-helix domain-containing protein [Acidipila sp. EB88]